MTASRWLPFTVTSVPTGPDSGVNEVIFGGRITTNVSALRPEPFDVVTVIFPLGAFAGTFACSIVSPSTVTSGDARVPNFTIGVAVPVRFNPSIWTFVPGCALAGEKPVIVGDTLNAVALDAAPPGPSTAIRPVEAVGGTVTLIWAAVMCWSVALTPPTVALVTRSSALPLTATRAPTGPEAGANDVIFGGRYTVNEPALTPEPDGVVTVTLPLIAVGGTSSVILSSATLWNTVAAPVPNSTFVAPVKFEPSISTCSPRFAAAGVKPVTVGMTLKSVALVPVPSGEVTLILPVDAPCGTTAFSDVPVMFVTVIAGTSLKLTADAPRNPEPLTVTVDPTPPEAGRKLVTGGATIVGRCTLPAPYELSLPAAPRFTALLSRKPWSCAGSKVGYRWDASAAVPATRGAEADVPENPGEPPQLEKEPKVTVETES